MKGITAAVVAFAALALGGCASEWGSYGTRPPAAHAYRDMYHRAPARARAARTTPRTSKPMDAAANEPAGTTGTVGGSTLMATPRMYSPEWWEQERAREARENDRIRRVIQICQGC